MNEKKRILIVIIIFGLFIALIVFGVIQTAMSRQRIVDDFNATYSSKIEKLIYLGRPGCSACITFKPTLEKVMSDYNLTYLDINTDNISENQVRNIVEKLNLKWDNFGTPTIAIVKNNKVVKSNIGVISEDSLVTFLKNGGLIKEGDK